jgi:hypothetical protein
MVGKVSTADASSRLETARALLADQLASIPVQQIAPDPPLDELGALAGFGAMVIDHDLRLSVYVLDAWGRGHDHTTRLRARAEASGRLASVAVNGDLLFFGTIAAERESTDRYLLNDLCGAFAGRE